MERVSLYKLTHLPVEHQIPLSLKPPPRLHPLPQCLFPWPLLPPYRPSLLWSAL